MKNLSISILFIFAIISSAYAERTVRVLAIGNSFSRDVVEQNLHELAAEEGVTMIIGNVYIGGCNLERHLNNARADKAVYSYRKIDESGERTVTPQQTLFDGLTDERWDYIVIQQQSALAGVYCSYGRYLPELLAYCKQHAPKAKFAIHQTWAYEGDSQNNQFAFYDYDQTKMYEAIVQATKQIFEEEQYKFVLLFPVGTAIQNARTTHLGDNLTADGYHLEKKVGRYIGACVWCEILTGKSVVGNKYTPNGVSQRDALAAQKSAHGAVLQPYMVTKIK